MKDGLINLGRAVRVCVIVGLWLASACSFGLVLLGMFGPADMERTDLWFVGVSWVEFLAGVFRFHIGLALLGALVAAALLRAKVLRVALVPVVLIALWPTIMGYVPGTAEVDPADPRLRVMSANLLWWAGVPADGLLEQIEHERPDVIMFQEYHASWQRVLAPALAEAYPHRFEHAAGKPWGMAIYSKRPFRGEPYLVEVLDTPHRGWQRPVLAASVEFDGRPVELRNVHLMSPGGRLRHVLMRDPKSLDRVVAQRLQTAALAEHVDTRSGAAMIVAGDFNAPQTSSNMSRLFEAGLVDTFSQAGFGRGSTWPNRTWKRHLPGLRLDHVLMTDELECVRSVVGEAFGSDHRPVIADIRWRDASAPRAYALTGPGSESAGASGMGTGEPHSGHRSETMP